MSVDFDALFRQYGRQVFWAAWRRTEDWHDAEDAAQNAFLRAWELRSTRMPDEFMSAVAWLTTVAKWEALTVLRQGRRYVPAGDWAERFAEREDRDTSGGGPCTADPETCAAVYAALGALTDQQRLALQMQCLQGMDRQDAARCLRISLHDVSQLTQQALRRLERASTRKPRARVRPAADARPAGVVDKQVADLLLAHPAAVAALSQRQREALEMRAAGMSFTQIAARWGCAHQTVVGAVRLAKQRLREPAKPRARGHGARHDHVPPSPHVLRVLNTPELLAALPPRQREAIILRFREGLGKRETAARMGATPPAVSQLVQKVMKRERRRVAEQQGATR